MSGATPQRNGRSAYLGPWLTQVTAQVVELDGLVEGDRPDLLKAIGWLCNDDADRHLTTPRPPPVRATVV
jgi:hypothetical protein